MNINPNNYIKCAMDDCANITDLVVCDDCADEYSYEYELWRESELLDIEARLS